MKKYANPPITEVKVKIEFDSKKDWSIIIPGQFYENSKELLPIIEYPNEKNKDQLPLFFSKDRDFNVTIPNQAISFKFIKPYKSWDSCKDVINRCITYLKNIVNIEDIARINLDYSNRIEIEKNSMVSYSIFNLSIEIQDDLKERMKSLLSAFEVKSKINDESFLVLIGSSEPDEEKNIAYTFNISSSVGKKQKDAFIKLENLFYQLDLLHEGIEEVFQLILTDKTKQSFVELTNE